MNLTATQTLPPLVRRAGVELAVLVAFGLLLGLLSPWDSHELGWAQRHAYWMTTVVGGGLIGVAIDEALARRMPAVWLRVLLVSVVMTPLVALWVLGCAWAIQGEFWGLRGYLGLLWQVFAICLPIMTVRALVRRAPKVETRTVIAAPLPEAEAAFRRRLSARRRTARLIAVEAHDHYLKVHTDAGEELITLRFADALSELARVHGYQAHRSWWVAAEAIEAVSWRRGAGEVRLAGGVVAPVSRRFMAELKAAGWR